MQASRLNWGLILIILGLVLLGWSTGRMPFGVVVRLVDMWPVLLIAIGIQMIFAKSKFKGMAYLSTLLILGAAFYAAAPYWDQISSDRTEATAGKKQASLEADINAIEADIEFSFRDFSLDDYLGKGVEFRYDHEFSQPYFKFEERDNIGRLKIDRPSDHWLKDFKRSDLPQWKVMLSDDHPVNLYLKGEKAYCYLRMEDLNINMLDLNCEKCYDVVLEFGSKFPTSPVDLDLDKSKLKVLIPAQYVVMLRDGSILPDYIVEDLGYFRHGEDLISDTIYNEDSLLVLDIAPGLRQLEIIRR